MIRLQSGHLVFDSDLVSQIMGSDEQINMVYYPERNDLLIAPRSKTFFQKLHKTSWTALKLKNPKGDKTAFVRDLLIDHEIDDSDRVLSYDVKTTGIIEIKL